MRNWDLTDEIGKCTIDQDYEDAKWVCNKINIPFYEVNLVKEYWNEVFLDFLDEYEQGVTPNPDILCNKNIKFGHFFKFAVNELKADSVCTGHYAQLSYHDKPFKGVKLCKAVDKIKDQTFFLSQVPQKSLQHWLFPIGSYHKREVREMAIKAGLNHIVKKKESMGICFVGKRNFQMFIDEYLPQKNGRFVDIDTHKVVGEHTGIHHYTLGQRCKLGGLDKAYFVAEKCPKTQDILVASWHDHPSLHSDLMFTDKPVWIYQEPEELKRNSSFNCQFRFQNKMGLVDCNVKKENDELVIKLLNPLRALTPGQYAALYNGEECLGSARIQKVSFL